MIVQKSFAIDFDGTISFHDFPLLGRPVPDAVRVVKRLQNAGHYLILVTMRNGNELDEAKAWLKDQGLYFHDFNCNTVFETSPKHTGSRKTYANWHIDDHNLGTKLIWDLKVHKKPYVDWNWVEKTLEQMQLL